MLCHVAQTYGSEVSERGRAAGNGVGDDQGLGDVEGGKKPFVKAKETFLDHQISGIMTHYAMLVADGYLVHQERDPFSFLSTLWAHAVPFGTISSLTTRWQHRSHFLIIPLDLPGSEVGGRDCQPWQDKG